MPEGVAETKENKTIAASSPPKDSPEKLYEEDQETKDRRVIYSALLGRWSALRNDFLREGPGTDNEDQVETMSDEIQQLEELQDRVFDGGALTQEQVGPALRREIDRLEHFNDGKDIPYDFEKDGRGSYSYHKDKPYEKLPEGKPSDYTEMTIKDKIAALNGVLSHLK